MTRFMLVIPKDFFSCNCMLAPKCNSISERANSLDRFMTSLSFKLPFLSPQLVLDEMMVEQTDLVRLRLVRMSNVPDTLYMVNNAVPQCCHMVNHQQMTVNSVAAPSVVANEIPGEVFDGDFEISLFLVRFQVTARLPFIAGGSFQTRLQYGNLPFDKNVSLLTHALNIFEPN